MSCQYGNCAICKTTILVSCTNGDWHPAMYKLEAICSECYDELKVNSDLIDEGFD